MPSYNLCSGQRPFSRPFINVDKQEKWDPDIVADCSDLSIIADGTADMVVIHHGLEHFGCGEGDAMLRECFRILRDGGSLIVCVPDLLELAKMWMRGKITDETYIINLYGAYMGDEADRHKFGFTARTLAEHLMKTCDWRHIKSFDYRAIPGADIARDLWIAAVEAVK